MRSTCHALREFWSTHPALFYSLALLLGCYGALYTTLSVFIPAVFLWLPYFYTTHEWQKGCTHICLMAVMWCYISIEYYQPPLIQDVEGIAEIHIDHLTYSPTLFGKKWMYICTLRQFTDVHHAHIIAKNLHCKIAWDASKKRPLANQDYVVLASLKQTEGGFYILKPKKGHHWQPIHTSWSLAERRYHLKKQVKRWIQEHIPIQRTAAFLGGLATGEFEDHDMQYHFSRFGLQHIMAISGFHFAILASVIDGILRLFLKKHLRSYFILACLSTYFLFLGCSASVLRSWLMLTIGYLGILLHKPYKPLNALGIALIGVIIIDPLLCQTLGFQFSFLVTAAILTFTTSMQHYIHLLWPDRSLEELHPWDRMGSHCLSLIKQGLALSMTVNLVALPLTLYYFHQFPWMSLIYNLFFPFFVSISMTLLLVGLLLNIIPYLNTLIHLLNAFYTEGLLDLLYYYPGHLNHTFYFSTYLPNWLYIIYFCTLFTYFIKSIKNLNDSLN